MWLQKVITTFFRWVKETNLLYKIYYKSDKLGLKWYIQMNYASRKLQANIYKIYKTFYEPGPTTIFQGK